jgi:putative protein-disulfide isomerase
VHKTLLYVHDPMCSWCYAFRPTWEAIVAGLPAEVSVRRLVGGLAPDTDQPMPVMLRDKLQATWRRIQEVVPGTEFNFAFWSVGQPRRATYPACRAVLVAARHGGHRMEEAMIRAIQDAYYRQGRNPSEIATLVALAGEIGLDPARFAADLAAPATQEALERALSEARARGADSFPTLLWLDGRQAAWVRHDYRDAHVVLDQVKALLAGAYAR